MKVIHPDSADSLIRVGFVSGTHGLHGAVRLRIDNPDSDVMQRANRLTLIVGGMQRVYKVTAVQAANRATFRVTFDGIDAIEQAEALRGAIVMIDKSELPPTAPGEFYYYQAIGCEVLTITGQRIGAVVEVFSGGANDVLVVREADNEVLVPVIEDVVKSIDLRARVITVDPVPGLLDPA